MGKFTRWLGEVRPSRGVCAVDSTGTVTYYGLKYRLDGQPVCRPGKGHPPYILVLDPSLPFRRRLQAIPTNRSARQALMRASMDRFPFEVASAAYALSTIDGQPYLCAMPRDNIQEFLPDGPLCAVLVSDGPPTPTGVEHAIEKWWHEGSCASLFPTNRWQLPIPYVVGGVLLGIVLALGVVLLWNLPAALDTEKHASAALSTVEKQGTLLLQRHDSIEKMSAALKALDATKRDPATSMVAPMISTIPAGVSISRMRYAEGKLTLQGSGGFRARDWLVSAGVDGNAIQLIGADPNGPYDAQIVLPQPPQ